MLFGCGLLLRLLDMVSPGILGFCVCFVCCAVAVGFGCFVGLLFLVCGVVVWLKRWVVGWGFSLACGVGLLVGVGLWVYVCLVVW